MAPGYGAAPMRQCLSENPNYIQYIEMHSGHYPGQSVIICDHLRIGNVPHLIGHIPYWPSLKRYFVHRGSTIKKLNYLGQKCVRMCAPSLVVRSCSRTKHIQLWGNIPFVPSLHLFFPPLFPPRSLASSHAAPTSHNLASLPTCFDK